MEDKQDEFSEDGEDDALNYQSMVRSKTTPDLIISGIIDYVDTDGDVKTLSFEEFRKMMQADFLA